MNLENKKCHLCGKDADGKQGEKYICIDCLYADENNKDDYLTPEQIKENKESKRTEKEIKKNIEKTEKEIDTLETDLVKEISEKGIIHEESGTITEEQLDKLKPTKKDKDTINISDLF